MSYIPLIKSGTPRQTFRLGSHVAVLLGDIVQAEDSIEYLYIMVVYEGDSEQPCLFVASEVNANAAYLGGGSHFLCVFEGNRHINCGSSDDWADEAKFVPEALRLIHERLDIPDGLTA